MLNNNIFIYLFLFLFICSTLLYCKADIVDGVENPSNIFNIKELGNVDKEEKNIDRKKRWGYGYGYGYGWGGYGCCWGGYGGYGYGWGWRRRWWWGK
ncbi:hypothetical protein ACQ4LE_007910 [Meloidogyne hapla]